MMPDKLIKAILFITIISMLVFAGCQIGGRYGDSGVDTLDFHTGKTGVEASIIEQAPPNTVYEDTSFDLQLQFHNKGAFNLEENNHSLRMGLKYDSSAVRMKNAGTGRSGRYDDLENIHLVGKSQTFPDGQKKDVAVAEFEVRDLVSNYERSSARFILPYCYPYHTEFSESVCVDTDSTGTDARQQSCSAANHTYSQGQGAPVGVTSVESQMIPVGDYIKPQFTIQLEKYGDGYVSAYNLDHKGQGCGVINTSTINKIGVEARLANDTLNCKPNQVRFEEGKAEVQCQLDDSDILGLTSSYTTELYVEASYLYKDKVSKEITVKRSGDPVFYSEQDLGDKCLPWEKRYDDKCVSKCEYYALNYDKGKFEEISDELKRSSTPWNIRYSPLNNIEADSKIVQETVYNSLGCIYKGRDSCQDAGANCIPSDDLCFSGTYCGWPACMESNNAPQVHNIRQEGDMITWQCYDQDAQRDMERTCGCSDVSYYAFTDYNVVDLSTHCRNLPKSQFKKVKGSFTKVHGMHFRTDLNEAESARGRICLMVEDKLGERTISSFTFEKQTPQN